MALRPIAFSIPSSTELKVVFSDSVSKLVSKDNFKVESLSGNTDSLEVSGVTIEGRSVVVQTKPQVSGNYYLIKMLDADGAPFESDKGASLIRDEVSREIFFVGIDNINPIRDRIFENIPNFYNLDNTNLSKVLKAHSKELYTAQKGVGEVLSDNYISVRVRDELRTRSSGATDRLIHENAYEVERVSNSATGNSVKPGKIEFYKSNATPRSETVSSTPISLRQRIITDEEISISSKGNNFDGYLLSLANKNVIKLLKLSYIKKDEEHDCNSKIGKSYNIEKYKYSMLNNYFDSKYSFKYFELKSNQVLLSEFGNISEPKAGDTLLVSYVYEDMGRSLIESSVSVFNIKNSQSESLPFSSTHFFLDNAPIVDSNNVIYTKNGVKFTKGENSSEVPPEFLKELSFDYSKLPNRVGEYSINYKTGEVFVFGSDGTGGGVGDEGYIPVASYSYRNTFSESLDYVVSENNIVANSTRILPEEGATIIYKYDQVYAQGIDYNSKCHIEVLNEQVRSSIGSSFSIKPKNTPVTDVFRIYNQTTGEVYNHLYSNDSEIFFSGIRSPEIKSESLEPARFSESALEDLSIVGEFVFPAFTTTVVSSSSNNNIQLEQGIPSELINKNSTDYFIREKSEDSDSNIEASDLQIRFFGDEDSNGLIHSVSVSEGSVPPDKGSEVTIGPRGFVANLNSNRVLNRSQDGIGSSVNTSVSFDNTDIFKREKFFNKIDTNPGLKKAAGGGLISVISSSKGDVFYSNLSRVRKVGDYCIDYSHGVIYVAVGAKQEYEIGSVTYFGGEIDTNYKNIITANQAIKASRPSDRSDLYPIIYNNLSNNNDSIEVLDLDETLHVFDNSSKSFDSNNKEQYICKILDDYTAIVPYTIRSINGIFYKKDLEGLNVLSGLRSDRHQDLGSDKINLKYELGGGDIYDASVVTFSGNTLDFKNSKVRRLTRSGKDLVLSIQDASINKFLDVKLSGSDDPLFDDDLNVPKITGISIVSVEEGDYENIVSIKSGVDLSAVDSLGDLLLDSRGRLFEILEADPLLSTLKIRNHPYRSKSKVTPSLAFSGDASIVVKASVIISNNRIDISIPGDSILSDGDPVVVRYLNDFVPEVGAGLAIDFSYGDIFIDYSYVYDDVYVSYEYGDNEIDWGSSDAITEGEQYYVTYKYGALRNALRNNFGDLTGIPYFKTFSIETDREVYRNAISGALQSFPKGPTIPAFNNLISSFTDMAPNINESAFGSWILGNDYCAPSEVEYGGNLTFDKGRFNQGLRVSPGNFVCMPSVSNLSLSEGTISAWIKPDWSGIDNDATLTFDIQNIGTEQYIYKNGKSLFDDGFDVLHSSSTIGGLSHDSESIEIYNFSENNNNIECGTYALSRNLLNVNRSIKTEHSLRFSVKDLLVGAHNPKSDRFCTPFFTSISDGNRILAVKSDIKFIESLGSTLEITISEDNLKIDSFTKYDDIHPTRNTSFPITDTLSESLNFREKVIVMDFERSIDISNVKVNNIFDNTTDPFMIINEDGVAFKILSFIDGAGRRIGSIPDEIWGVVIERIPFGKPELSSAGSAALNSYIPNGKIKIAYQSVSIISTNRAIDSGKVWGYSDVGTVIDFIKNPVTISMVRDPVSNHVEMDLYKYNDTKSANYRLFYTDLPHVSNASSILKHFGIKDDDIEGLSIINALSGDNGRFSVGTIDRGCKSTLDLYQLGYKIYNKFSAKDIYIGRGAISPSRIPFSVNREDASSGSVGIPFNSDYKEGVFIGFDELCESPLSDDSGQWVFRTRVAERQEVPVAVSITEAPYMNLNVSVADADEEPSNSNENILPNFFWIDGDITPEVSLKRGSLYRFNQSDITNISGLKKIKSKHHVMALSTTADGTHNGGREYLRGVVRSSSEVGGSESYLEISVDSSTPPKLYYYCKNHSGMGGEIKVYKNTTRESGKRLVGYEYENETALVPIKQTVAGVITTNGDFSSVIRAFREEDGTGCPPGIVCSDTYRYCGGGLLETSGWKKIDESDSDLINTIIGGRETNSSPWVKYGEFSTSISGGVYRAGESTPINKALSQDSSLGNFLYTRAPCHLGDVEIISSVRVVSVDSDLTADTGNFYGSISGKLNGIVPINFNDGSINIKISLATGDDGSPLVLIMDAEDGSIIDIAYYDWNNGLFNNFSLLKNIEAETIEVRVNNALISKIKFDELIRVNIDSCKLLKEPYVAIYLNDGSILDTGLYHKHNSSTKLDIDLIYFSGKFKDGVSTLESDDILINTDSKIDFEFYTRVSSHVDGYGMPLYASSDAYDAYAVSNTYDVDEMYITSDLNRYVFDSGSGIADGRMSLFKDGKGFFNFRIFNSRSGSPGSSDIFNIATNIKHFRPGELHHIGASWKLNSLSEKDEMHLFIDGTESPNIYRFGGAVPVSVNEKFSDISKETLHNFMVSEVEFNSVISDGSTLAGTSRFFSKSAGFTEDMIGRSIIITESELGDIYVGKQYIINSVDGDAVTFVTGKNMDPVSFDASVSNIKFKLPPLSGVGNKILTDLKNNAFSIIREDCFGVKKELGGILYSVKDGVINIISGSQIDNPEFRANIDSRLIEFVGMNKSNCKYGSTVEYSDTDIHIETFGLTMQRYRNVIELSGSSYKTAYGLKHPYMRRDSSGDSTVLLNAPDPIRLSDVSIRRIISDRQLVVHRNITDAPKGYVASFEVNMPSKSLTSCPSGAGGKANWLTSQSSELLHKQNLGRYLEVSFDSDNVHFCEKFDGYSYDDGYSSIDREIDANCDGADCWPSWAGQYCGGKIVPLNSPSLKEDVFASESDTHIYIISDGIPHDHDILDQTDGGAVYDANNPLEAKQQFYRFSIPRFPVFADDTKKISEVPVGPIGVAINGVPFHGPLDELGVKIDESGITDGVGGYVNQRGEYFYYKDPKGLYNDIYGEHSPKIGYAFDGFEIYGKQCNGGSPPTNLDEFGGHYHDDIGYHYHVGESKPGIISGFRGKVEMSNFDKFHRNIPPVYPFSEITSGIPSMITIFGETIDGSNHETLLINENGRFQTTKLFKEVEKIEGSMYIADSDYEIGVISLSEKNPITISDNGGDYAEVYDFSAGVMKLTVSGSDGSMPFELHAGRYAVDYPAHLKVELSEVGRKMYIGTDMNKENSLSGVIDEFRIISEMSSDTRSTERYTSGTRSITDDYNRSSVFDVDKQTLCLMHFDDPIGHQDRSLRRKEFLNSNENYKFKLDAKDRESLIKSINNKDEFVSKMLKMGFSGDDAISTYVTCHRSNNGPIKNMASFYPGINDFPLGAKSVNDKFGSCAKFSGNIPLLLSNSKNIFRRKEGCIEFWVSPLNDSLEEEDRRYYVDVYSAERKRVTSTSPSKIVLPVAASKIVSIRLLSKKSEYSKYYTSVEKDRIIFDEISRSSITGRLSGGTGTDKDFSVGHVLGGDGRSIIIQDALPGRNTDVIVDYIPLDSSGDRVSVFRDTNNDIVFSITANGIDNVVRSSASWSKNSWHRVMCMYKTNSSRDTMRIFVDGDEGGAITYGQDIIYGSGFVYGQIATKDGANRSVNYNISLNDEFRLISIGSDIFNDYSGNCRLDNIRFSRKNRRAVKDSSGVYVDTNYGSNLDTVSPVSKDSFTTLMLNFNNKIQKDDNFATIIDQNRGIFNFDIEVVDDFGKIKKEETEDLMIELVDRLKPAHANANVRFLNNTVISKSSKGNSADTGYRANSAKANANSTSGSAKTDSSSGSSGSNTPPSSPSSSGGSGGGYSY